MSARDLTTVINLLGYLCGASLYAMLLMMVAQRRRSSRRGDALPLLTAVLGLTWNAAGLLSDGFGDVLPSFTVPLQAVGFVALGCLPAVVIHAALRTAEPLRGRAFALWITVTSYVLSAAAAGMQIHAAVAGAAVPSPAALLILTIGFGVLLCCLLIHASRPVGGRQALLIVALAVFAVTALHWGHHRGGEAWHVVLLGHHASLPLVLAILYQDYRFALADSFLKRALALIALTVVALAFSTTGAALLDVRTDDGRLDAHAMAATIVLWLGTALLYPLLSRASGWFVDVVVLRRSDYADLCREIAERIARQEVAEGILGEVCGLLAPALNAREVGWQIAGLPIAAVDTKPHAEGRGAPSPVLSAAWLSMARASAVIPLLTADAPRYLLLVGTLAHGRRLLSDDLAMLEAVAVMAGRRIDAVRVAHERCERAAREQELQSLAVQAELRELRAQLDPHFLFNALTTVAFLVQSAPAKGLDALMQLTTLLRAVLQRTAGEFVTLGEEIDLVESYLAIEQARFEDRLTVTIDVPRSVRQLRLPPLVIQPLVENALKHGIARSRHGGAVAVHARATSARQLRITVSDTGVGAEAADIARGRDAGLGLGNVSRRLAAHYGTAAGIEIVSAPGLGTTVAVHLPAAGAGETLARHA